MKYPLGILTALLLVSPVTSRAAEETARKPNILLIYSDDHGWADLGAQGVDSDIRTPNFDAFVRDGVLFKRGYVTAPQCVPSRAGVITGRYQQRFGVEDNNKGPLPLAQLTLAERLRPAGYVTGHVGKWHLDIGGGGKGSKATRVRPEHMPHAQGFDEYWRGELRQFHASHDLKGRPFPDAPHLVTDDRCRVVVQTEAALGFLDRRAIKPDQPWFLYLAWFAPHVPLESPEPWFSQTPTHLPKERRQALAMIGAMDDGLGRLRAKLREMGQERNTLIFFIGDNGAPLGGAWNGSLNGPLKGQKGMLSEGGIRVPFVAAWPGTLPAGQTYDHPVISLDVAATAVAIAGQPRDPALDGVNLMPFLTGHNKASPHDTLYWRWGSQAAILEFPYKLIALGDRERLLFDITTPDGENTARNLIRQKPDIAARLEAKLKSWCDSLQPPGLPTTFDKHHEDLFVEHELIPTTDTRAAKNTPAGSVQGWLCRNGSLSIKDGALIITSDPNAAPNSRTFITTTNLDLAGQVTATLRIRATRGGKSTFTWRTKAASFDPDQTATFEWPTSRDWHDVNVELLDPNRIIHVRITPANGVEGAEIQVIELRDKNGKTQRWDFSSTK